MWKECGFKPSDCKAVLKLADEGDQPSSQAVVLFLWNENDWSKIRSALLGVILWSHVPPERIYASQRIQQSSVTVRPM